MATEKVRRKQVRDLTFKLLTENGLDGWKVRFNPRLTRALGRCWESRKTIEYQPRYMEQNPWSEVEQTVRHEVAHAVAGARAGHGARWVREALRLGVKNPSSTSKNAVLTKKFTATCEGCGAQVHRDRRTYGIIHPTCYRKYQDEKAEKGESTQRYSFTWARNA